MLKKLLSPNNASKQEVTNSIFFIRLLLSLSLGLIWTALRLEGALALLSYFTVVGSTLDIDLTHFVSQSFLVIDWFVERWLKIDSPTNKVDYLLEGFAPGLATFILVWTLGYTGLRNDLAY